MLVLCQLCQGCGHILLHCTFCAAATTVRGFSKAATESSASSANAVVTYCYIARSVAHGSAVNAIAALVAVHAIATILAIGVACRHDR